MRKICFITGTRADYGILAPIMKEVSKSSDAELQIIATNMHLSPQFGMTVNEIESDGFEVNVKIESLAEGASAKSTVESMARVEAGLATALDALRPDMVVILGDRYEALAAASAAVVFNIPVAHLHGGETTEGAIDDKFRHAITQLSTYHFAATPQYADRIISMGADPDKVFHSGAPGACADLNSIGSDTTDLAETFVNRTGIKGNEPFILLAFHPVTTLPDHGEKELKATLKALDGFIDNGYKVLVTLPNSDPGNDIIIQRLKEWSLKHLPAPFPVSPLKVVVEKSLGSGLFHFALDNAAAIVGNSSAALIEAPSHRLGAVNVGIRQKGRAHGLTVIDVPGDAGRIETALRSVMSLEMKSVLMGMSVAALNPYFKEDSPKFIADKLLTL